MGPPIVFTNGDFPLEGYRHYLVAYKSAAAWTAPEMPYPVYDPDVPIDPDHDVLCFSAPAAGGGYWNCVYWMQWIEAPVPTDGRIRAHCGTLVPNTLGIPAFADYGDPLGVVIEYSNPTAPCYSESIWAMPFTPTTLEAGVILTALINAQALLSGAVETRIYDGDINSYAPADIADLPVNFRVGLLGVNREGGVYVYQQLDPDPPLPLVTGDGQPWAFDAKGFIEYYFSAIRENFDALTFWPIIEGGTVTPGTTIGPEFMLGLLPVVHENGIVLPLGIDPEPQYSGTVVYRDIQWTPPILNLGTGRMTIVPTGINPRSRISPLMPPGLRR